MSRWLALPLALLLACASTAFTWAVADDYATREVLPEGVSAAGLDIGGLSRAQAHAAIEREVVEPYTAPFTLKVDDVALEVPAGSLVRVDVERMIDEAYGLSWAAVLPQRVYRRASGRPLAAEVPMRSSVDEGAVRAWVASAAAQIALPAVDATYAAQAREVRVVASRTGRALDRETAARNVTEALLRGEKSASLPVKRLTPRVTEANLGKAVLVSLGQRRLRLYDAGALEKTYGVAIGAEGHETPLGRWRVINKRYMPTWRNPGSAWAKDMPKAIPPGPGNPLGTRALDLNASGIRIHGTTQDGSIGSAASHGCLRMHRWDVEDLFPRVPVGTPVFIVR